MALIFLSDDSDAADWQRELELLHPDIDFRLPVGQANSPNEITYALVNPQHCTDLHQYPGLKAVFSLYAGVDDLLKAPEKLPIDVPLIRLISSDLSLSMCQYVVQHCLNYLRHQHEYFAQAQARRWRPLAADDNRCNVGIMGLGQLGQAAGEKLADLGFNVSGWSLTKKSSSIISCYAGAAQLPEFLAGSHILVALLPLTAATSNLFDKDLFALLPPGACFINAGRGLQVVDNDLIACLDSGQLSGATLDVFREEPLPRHHSFWRHPKITITPHVASVTRPCRESAQWIVDNIISIDAGNDALGGVVNRRTGY